MGRCSIYNEELQRILSFTEENKDLVESAIHVVAISIMKSLNDFNLFESQLTTLIANYYMVSYSPQKDFKTDVLDTGYLSFGQKVHILKDILAKNHYPSSRDNEQEKLIAPMKTLGSLRNNIIHSVYGLDPKKVDNATPVMIICTNSRKIEGKDLMKTFSEFEKYLNKSNDALNNVANFVLNKEVQN